MVMGPMDTDGDEGGKAPQTLPQMRVILHIRLSLIEKLQHIV